jgi:hypothetical protein
LKGEQLMKKLILKLLLFSCVLSVAAIGCDSLRFPGANSNKVERPVDSFAVHARYTPTKVSIMPLTKFEKTVQQNQSQIHTYISLLDSFGSQVKSPCIFRFELYDKVELSSQPKGSRIVMWPDMDLTEPVENNKYWSDFFRAYEFRLGFEPKQNKSYILQVTSIDPGGKRLSDEIVINSP